MSSIEGDPVIVTSIDVGTSYSGYAFCKVKDYRNGPLTGIFAYTRWGGGSSSVMSLKTPTYVLFKPNKEFHSFGYEAENTYSKLALQNNHKEWRYFRRFKMELYLNQKLGRNFEIMDEQKQQMPAMAVFTEVIKFLKTHFMEKCVNMIKDIKESDIVWVITVPAIWSDSSKQFMREAAQKAGIVPNRLQIALEPEVASIFCKQLSIEKDTDGGLRSLTEGSRYAVLDAGGGTVDITVHEVQKDGHLKAIHCPNGGDWGGSKVDEAFKNFLIKIVGEDAMESFHTNHMSDKLELFRDFESKKREVKMTPDEDSPYYFTIPGTLDKCCKDANKGKGIEAIIKSRKDLKQISVIAENKMKVDWETVHNWFDDTVTSIVEHLRILMTTPTAEGITTILMVGGFSEADILQKNIKKAFPQVHVTIPPDAELTVLKGAVVFGCDPNTISSRVLRYTYGVETTVLFERGEHTASKMYRSQDGEIRCKDIFDKHAEMGQSVKIDEPQQIIRYNIGEANQSGIDFTLYRSTEKKPKNTTDDVCMEIGKLCIEMPDTSLGLRRGVELQMTFGKTELEVKAYDTNTGSLRTKCRAKFDFLD